MPDDRDERPRDAAVSPPGMDTLTHALSGALLARATAPRAPRPGGITTGRRVAAGFVAAAFPDVDWALSLVSTEAYLLYHRGATHSILLLPLWAALLAWIFARLDPARPGWRAYFGVAAGSLAIHIAGDLITSFGTILLAPVSDRRFALDTTFIIDLWFTGIIVAGLAASLVWRRSRVPAAAGLAALAGYVGLQALAHGAAVDFGREYARAQGLAGANVSAVPRPISPFNWMVVVAHGDEYRYAFVNVIRRTAPPPPGPAAGLVARLDAAYAPRAQAVWQRAERFGPAASRAEVLTAWQAEPLAFFRWFAAYPVLARIEAGNPVRCIWFRDLRFLTPGRAGWPFQFGVCRSPVDAGWIGFQLIGDAIRLPLR